MPGVTVNSRAGPSSSSKKRSRGVADGLDDEELLQVQEASSSLRHESRTKRARVSEAGPSKQGRNSRRQAPSSSSSDSDVDISDASSNVNGAEGTESDVDDVEAGDEEGVPSATQYELMRDDGHKHLEHEDQDDQRATQRLQHRAAAVDTDVLGENRAAENGILESITCINFMCHTRLHCELGPLLNFIVGENGSGKSAILTAITLCLGGKASSTNRGGSLKNFVKEGQEQAVVTVRIKNRGADAYQRDVYGDSIIVERHFSRSGSSGFRIKSTAGRVISTTRSEVAEIVEYYCLQVDNPLNVLSQDNARQFLNASSASTKYKFFIQGVQLEQLDKDYQLVKEFLDSTQGKLPELEERVRAAKKEFEEAEKMLKQIQNNQDMRRKKRHYTNQLAWAQVVEQERKLEEYEQMVEAAEAKIVEAERMKEVKARALEKEDEKLRRAQDALATAKEDVEAYRAKLQEAQDEYESAFADLQSLHSDERDVHSRLRLASNREKEFDIKIREEQKRLEDANGDLHTETQERLAAAKRQVDDINREIAEANRRLPELEQEHESVQAEAKRMSAAVEQKKDDVQASKAKIRSLDQSRGGSSSAFDAYDRQLPQLLERIARDGGFAAKPIGPLGAHVRVKKPQWCSILETTLGSILNGFVVTSQRDSKRLRELMRQLKIQQCPIYVAGPQRIGTEGREPDDRFDTVLRVLSFDNELVRDQLILNNRIEQVILIEDRKEAQQVMFYGPAEARRNVFGCLSRHDKKADVGLWLASRGDGRIKTSPVIPSASQKPRMKSDLDSRIAAEDDVLHRHESDLRALEAERRQAQQHEQRCLKEIGTHRKRVETLRRDLRHAGVTINQIEEELDKFDGADGRLQALEEARDAARTEKDQYGGQYGVVHVKKTEQNKLVEQLKRQLTASKDEMAELEEKRDKAAANVEKCNDLRHLMLVAKNDAFENADMRRDDKRNLEAKRDGQAATVHDFIQQASMVTPERVYIPEGETHEGVEKKLAALNKQLEERRKKIGLTDEEVNVRAIEASQAYDLAKDILTGTQEQIAIIKQSLSARLAKWRNFQRYISANSRTNFIYLLSERGFRGKLLLDHMNKRLRVQIEPDETRVGASGRDTKTLSGGEKSFSSICLLLAIWEAMGSPLRCLDEFDVFMDNVNRAISTNMLVTAARRSVGRQFIMITPNAIQGQASMDKDVKIIRLTDPRQRTLRDY